MIESLVAAFALTLARVGTFIHVLPMLGGPNVPRTVKIGLSVALAVLFFDFETALVADEPSPTWIRFGLSLGREMLLGGVFGFALGLLLVPARVAGELIAQETGLTFANVVTATGDGSSNPFSVLLELIASMVFFTLDLHHIFLITLQETFRHFPIGQNYLLPTWDLIGATGAAQEGGIILAAPLALCLFLTTVVLGLMTRAAPQLNMYSIGFPLRVLICLGGTLLLLPSIVAGLVGLFGHFIELLQLRG